MPIRLIIEPAPGKSWPSNASAVYTTPSGIHSFALENTAFTPQVSASMISSLPVPFTWNQPFDAGSLIGCGDVPSPGALSVSCWPWKRSAEAPAIDAAVFTSKAS